MFLVTDHFFRYTGIFQTQRSVRNDSTGDPARVDPLLYSLFGIYIEESPSVKVPSGRLRPSEVRVVRFIEVDVSGLCAEDDVV